MLAAAPATAHHILSLLESLPAPLLLEVRHRILQLPTTASHTAGTASPDAALLERVHRIVHENLGNSNFGVEWLACEVALSSRQLQRRILAATQISVATYVRTQRIQRAALMLSSGHLPVTKVAYSVGFRDPRHFARTFKRSFGVSPCVYRSRHEHS